MTPSSPVSARYCGTICPCGPKGEPLACGYEKGHEGSHSWATLPTFLNGRTALEIAAIEYVQASRAEAERVARTARIIDPKAAEWGRKNDALLALIEAVEGVG